MAKNLLPVLLVVCLLQCSRGKHLLRFITFCQRNVSGEGQDDIKFDGDQLLYVDPVTYQAVQRLTEFAEQWTPDPGLPEDAYVDVGTCHYNIPNCMRRENNTPPAVASPSSLIYSKQEMELGVPNTLICFVDDFHPPEVEIAWTGNGQLVDQSDVSQTRYYSNSDFSFRLSSYLDFAPRQGDVYSCSVGHASLRAPLTRIWDGYVFQGMYDCEFGDDMKDMVFLVKNVYNQKLCTLYDSRVGKRVGFAEHCIKDAARYSMPPIVKVHQSKPADYGERSMLECSVWGFFPKEVVVSWLRDGVEVATDVASTDVLANGDWSYQLHSYLEFTPRRGERVTCRVEHKSLRAALEVDWDGSALDAKRLKKTAGIVSFFVGVTVAVSGAAYYWWKRRFDFQPTKQPRTNIST